MSFDKEFLTKLAKEKKLAGRETEVFLALFGEGKTRRQIAEKLHINISAVSSCLTSVYKKFGILDSGPVKESRLKDELNKREKIWQKKRKNITKDLSSIGSTINESLFQRVKKHCRNTIIEQYSQIRLLSGEIIRVDLLYVDVYLLERPENKLFNSTESFFNNYDVEKDRYALSRRIGNRISGIEIANTESKLMILGKPGSGKTTFLKHLAIDWINGTFQCELTCVFIELRRISNKKWDLLEAINLELKLDNFYQFSTIKKEINRLKQANSPREYIIKLEEQLST